MTNDPYPTNMLPDMGRSFPITEELPAVGPRGGGPTGRFFLKLVGALLIVGIAATAAILIIDSQRSNEVATGEPEAEPTVAPEPDALQPTPAPGSSVTELEAGDAGFWRVVGVDGGLNVRSGPGTENDVVGSLPAGSRHVFATGERSSVNGGEWKQIRFGTDDQVGWVSAGFLSADTPPSEDEPTPTATPAETGSTSIVCFRGDGSPGRIARLVFTNRTEISGVIRSIGEESTTDQTVEGTLDSGRAEVTLTDTASNARARQTWTFNPANVEVGNGRSLAVVSCDTIAGELA